MKPYVEHHFQSSSPGVAISPGEFGRKHSKGKKKGNSSARRFTEEQIKSLEFIFESETRLEPRKKVEVARELGLEPRQVAIWFQNKRARWRSKQVEKEYNLLRSNYNDLVVELETLKKENHDLTLQLQELNDLNRRRKPQQSQCFLHELPVGDAFDISPYEMPEHDLQLLSGDEFFGLKEDHSLGSMVEPSDSSITSLNDDWNAIDSEVLVDQSSISSYPQWWDFWS